MASFVRGTALVTSIASVAGLTGRSDLTSLEDDSELSIATILVAASDAIYDQLVSQGIDASAITNAEVYERCVSWHLLALLVISNHWLLPDGLQPPQNELGQADPYAWSDPHCTRVSPVVPTSDGVNVLASPRIGNRYKKPLFGNDTYYDDVVRRL